MVNYCFVVIVTTLSNLIVGNVNDGRPSKLKDFALSEKRRKGDLLKPRSVLSMNQKINKLIYKPATFLFFAELEENSFPLNTLNLSSMNYLRLDKEPLAREMK